MRLAIAWPWWCGAGKSCSIRVFDRRRDDRPRTLVLFNYDWDRVGFAHDLFNMDLFHNAATGKLTVIEFNPRLAAQFSDLYLRVDGIDLHRFAFFSAAESRLEMHLEALRDVTVRWPGGERRFVASERIHAENSYKQVARRELRRARPEGRPQP